MAVSRGKEFEKAIFTAFQKIDGMTIDRLPDPQAGYRGQRNICDYIGYHYPAIYYIECKSCHKKWLTRDDITDNQYNGLLAKSRIFGVVAGYFIWWVDYDVTIWVSAQELDRYFRAQNKKSLNIDHLENIEHVRIFGKKKRVLFEYDLENFVKEINDELRQSAR